MSIKEMCKKFENMSSNDNSVPCQPIRPARRRKNVVKSSDSESSNSIESPDLSQKQIPDSAVPSNFGTGEKRRLSVRERTKMFETNGTENHEKKNQSQISKFQSQISTDSSSFISEIPPAKPPRIFANSDTSNNCHDICSSKPNFNSSGLCSIESQSKGNGLKNDSNILEKIEKAPEAKMKDKHSEFRFRNGSFSPKSDVKNEPVKKRLASDPVVHSKHLNGEKVPKTPKLGSYFKSLSNSANNFCDKVKQSKIFVDLTPTTVSPPKHYGTLKKSLSEEHIYAELSNEKNSPKGLQEPPKVQESLHYMCTPLVKPKLPERNTDKNAFSRKFVRGMIYDSFAALRTVPKDSQDKKTPLETADSDVSMKAIEDRITYVKSVRQVSGSNICLAQKLFEALFIINPSESHPEVTHTFPLKIPDELKFPLLPHICFPDQQSMKAASVYQSDTFHFTLFDKGKKMFGYCLRISGSSENSSNDKWCVKIPVVICILSQFNIPLFYKKLLNEIEKHLALSRAKCFKYIRSLQKLGVPNAGANVSVPDYTEGLEDHRVIISRPLDSHTIGVELTRALILLDVDILLKAAASLLLERRVLLFSSSTTNLYHCCKAISALLYPFEWPHMFIPVLPSCLTVQCCSELPYVLGLLNNNRDSVLELLAEHELLIIDVDKGAIVKSCEDEDTILPKKIQRALITALNLAKNMTDPTEMMRDIMISEAFVHMIVELIGHYDNHIVEKDGDFIFQKEAFLKNAFSYSIHTFLRWFTETQMFETFISQSIWRANYRKLYQTNQPTFFENCVDEYKWKLSHDGLKFSHLIEKTVRNIGERIIHILKK